MVVQKLGQIQLLLDNMPSLAWMKNRNGQYLIINRLFEQFGIKNGILRLSLAGYTFLGQHNRLSVNWYLYLVVTWECLIRLKYRQR